MTTVVQDGKQQKVEKPELVGAAKKARARKKSPTERILERASNVIPIKKEKATAESRTETLPGVASTPDLTPKTNVVTVEVQPIECTECSGFGAHLKLGGSKEDCKSCNATGYANHKEMTMAAKKKNSKKSSLKRAKSTVAKGATLKNGAVMAAPIGRERKMLLRLSKDEYNALQAKAEKQGTSMANLLRTAALG